MKKMRMLKIIVSILVFILCVLSFDTARADTSMGMVTGGPRGTYVVFGRQIAEIGRKNGIQIEVKTSEGSLDNIMRIQSKENAALGIVQSDVLGFIQKQKNNPELQKFVRNLRLIFPFYNEEVHLYASKTINSIKDLQGKRVAIGTVNSGNWVTSKNLFLIMGVEPSVCITDMNPQQAAIEVVTGNIDAMIYVVGKPAKLFENFNNVINSDPKLVPYVKNTHFVPIVDEKILREYIPSSIGPSDYYWCDREVATVAVKAVLISYDFSRKVNAYQKMRCEQLSRLGAAMRNNLNAIKSKIDEERNQENKTWHPKWKEIRELDKTIGIWKLDKCSRSSLEDTGPNLNELIWESIQKKQQDLQKGSTQR